VKEENSRDERGKEEECNEEIKTSKLEREKKVALNGKEAAEFRTKNR
jgi:hypothetical protein